MINNADSQQAYIDSVMKRLPDVKKGEVHTMKAGDNLWNLAKKALNKENVSKQEISDYMLLIAKLNNLNTVEKMNSLKVSDKIYMPEGAAVDKPSGVKKQNTPAAVKQEPTSAETSILKLKETIMNDKTVFVERAYPRSINLYHVYNDYTDAKTGYHSRKHPLVSFNVNQDGSIRNVSFNDQQKTVNQIKNDYYMDAQGNIKIHDYIRQTKVGKMDKAEFDELTKYLQGLTEKASLTY